MTEAKMQGITPFCFTVDKDSEFESKDLYGDVGYTIIGDVLSLPERRAEHLSKIDELIYFN